MSIKQKSSSDKEKLKDATAKLKERVKELNCLYEISKYAEDLSITVEKLMQSVVDLMRPSFQYPEITCAFAQIGKMTFKTTNFKKTKWEIISAIKSEHLKDGYLGVYYLKEKPRYAEGPFLIEERYLIDSVCKSVGRIIDRIILTQKLKEVNSRYNILTSHFTEGIIIVQDEMIQFANESAAILLGFNEIGDLVHQKYSNYIHPNYIDEYLENKDISELARKSNSVFQYQIQTKTKQQNSIVWNDKKAQLSILRDISDLKKKEISIAKETQELRNENIRLRSSLKDRYRFQNIIGKSDVMQAVYESILDAANTDANVSIYGESGTGKELVANAIHNSSNRKGGGFVPVNCGAIPDKLLESEFFGHRKGAFTGAVLDKHGFLDLANKGSLFLDEIGELNISMQAKLLRAIDGGGYNPIGSSKLEHSDFRIIAATNKLLKNEVKNGKMREDFFYRVHVIPIILPPLRERKDDIPYLVDHFSKLHSDGMKYDKISDSELEKLYEYDWPGNVRELQNSLLRFFSTGQLEIEGHGLIDSKFTKNYSLKSDSSPDLGALVSNFERSVILEILNKNEWHRSKTAENLNITRNTLFRKMRKYGLKSIHTQRY